MAKVVLSQQSNELTFLLTGIKLEVGAIFGQVSLLGGCPCRAAFPVGRSPGSLMGLPPSSCRGDVSGKRTRTFPTASWQVEEMGGSREQFFLRRSAGVVFHVGTSDNAIRTDARGDTTGGGIVPVGVASPFRRAADGHLPTSSFDPGRIGGSNGAAVGWGSAGIF